MSLTCWGTWPSWTWGIIGWRTWMPPSSPGWRCFTARGTASAPSRPRVACSKASTPPTMVGFWHAGLHVLCVGSHVWLGKTDPLPSHISITSLVSKLKSLMWILSQPVAYILPDFFFFHTQFNFLPCSSLNAFISLISSALSLFLSIIPL